MFVIVNGVVVVTPTIQEKKFLIVECVERAPARRNAHGRICLMRTIFVTGIITARPVSRQEVFLVLQKTKIFIVTSK